MRNFKNLGLAAGALVLSVSLTACGGGNDADTKKDKPKAGDSTVQKVENSYQVTKIPGCDTYDGLLTTDSNFRNDGDGLIEDGIAMTAKEGQTGDWDSCDFFAGDIETTLSVQFIPWVEEATSASYFLNFPYDGNVDQGERYEASSLDSDSQDGAEYMYAEFGQQFSVDSNIPGFELMRGGVLRCGVHSIVGNAAEADANTINKLQLFSSKSAAEQCNKILDAFTEAAK